jgi:archaeal flagellin FlaB
MLQKFKRVRRDQKGITGLETAIILIAFVVVAAVFAYTVLSAGLFSTQKSQQAVYAGLKETQSTLELKGSVVAYQGDAVISSSVGKVEFTVSNAVKDGEALDLTPPYMVVGGALLDSGMDNPMQISFSNTAVAVADCAWSLSWIGKHSDDYYLENNEKAVITVWLHSYDGAVWSDGNATNFLATNDVNTESNFTLEVKPSMGAVLAIERTTPSALDAVMDLH